jgi:integrase
MSTVFPKKYTVPLPEGAERISVPAKIRGETIQVPHVRFKRKGKWVTATLTPDGARCVLYSDFYYGKVAGKHVKLFRDRAASEQRLAQLILRHERGEVGLLNLYQEHNARDLDGHLADFERELRTTVRRGKRRPPSQKQVRLKVARIRAVLAGCGFGCLADITLAPVQEFLAGLTADRPGAAPAPDEQEFTLKRVAEVLGIKAASVAPLVARHNLVAEGNGKARKFPRATVEALLAIRGRGKGDSTVGYYAREVKAFPRWLADAERLPRDPLAKLPGAGTTSSHRHDRRALTEAELRRLLVAADASPRTIRGLAGRDRWALYLTAMSTGFRAEELSTLTPRLFELDATPPVVRLAEDASKNDKGAVQPLPTDVAEALAGYLEGRPAHLSVWPGTWVKKPVAVLRKDLEAAGIPYTVPGPDGPLHAYFHALRHSFVALLDRAGVSLKQAMQLARHSDPKLTMAVYGRAHLHDLAGAVERLPALTELPSASPDSARATGTAGISHPPPPLFPSPVLPLASGGEGGRAGEGKVKRHCPSPARTPLLEGS